MIFDAVQNTWVDGLEQFLEGYGLPTTIASVVAIVVIIGIPTLVQIVKLMSAAKDNTAYRGIMLTRIVSDTAYSKRVAEASKKTVELFNKLISDLSACKRVADVKSIAERYKQDVIDQGTEISDLISTGEAMINEYGTVPTKRALKEIEKAKKESK